MKVGKDKVVTIDYTLTDDKGEVLDTSKNHGPLSYIHGKGNIIPGLEQQLDGKSSGDKLTISVAPDDAYGQRDEKRIVTLPRDQFRGVDQLEVGMQFRAEGSEGAQVVTVTAVENDSVTVDANHPLAGVTLNFDVAIVNVREATADELSHGHVHGPGGAH